MQVQPAHSSQDHMHFAFNAGHLVCPTSSMHMRLDVFWATTLDHYHNLVLDVRVVLHEP